MITQELRDELQTLIDNSNSPSGLIEGLQETEHELFDGFEYDMDNESLDHASISEGIKKADVLMEEIRGAISKLAPMLEEVFELQNS